VVIKVNRLILLTSVVLLGGCNAEFKCNDKQELCDIVDSVTDDIGDGIVDEVMSQASEVGQGSVSERPFRCDDDLRIPSELVCDDEEDCMDGKDEADCD
jgi:hypothetical protein